jgi:hypothetical protein
MTSTHSQADTVEILSMEDTKRLLLEITQAAGPEGITEEELLKANDSFFEMVVHAGIVAAWSDESIRAGWDADAQELRFWPR